MRDIKLQSKGVICISLQQLGTLDHKDFLPCHLPDIDVSILRQMGLDNVASGYLLSCVDVHSDINDDTGFFFLHWSHLFVSYRCDGPYQFIVIRIRIPPKPSTQFIQMNISVSSFGHFVLQTSLVRLGNIFHRLQSSKVQNS